jgi:hypothetical protein
VSEGVESRLLDLSCCDQQRACRHHHGKLRDQVAATFDATVDAHASAAGCLRLSDRGVEKFRHADAIQHLAHVPRPFFGALVARDKVEHNKCLASSKFVSPPTLYGDMRAQVVSIDERNVPTQEQLSESNPYTVHTSRLHFAEAA